MVRSRQQLLHDDVSIFIVIREVKLQWGFEMFDLDSTTPTLSSPILSDEAETIYAGER